MATTSYAPPATLDRAQRNGLIAAIIGLALTAASYVIVSPEQFFHSYLLGFFVFFGLCMGSLGLLLLQYLSGGVWGMIARRIFEAGTRVLPVAALLFVPIIFGMHQIYSWMDPAKVAANPIIKDKVDYLNQSFWLVRAAIFFTYWVVISLVINKYAANLDKEPGFKWARKIENFSGVALLFYFITITLAIVDWLMSLTPEWYSTIFGFIIIVGQAVLTMAFTIIVLVKLSRDEPMASIIKPKHLHESAIKIEGVGESHETAGAKEEALAPVGPMLAKADVAAGEANAKKLCAACHTFNEGGKAGVGPNLYNIVAHPRAAAAGFGYSNGLKAKAGDWGYEDLNAWLKKPAAYAAGTKMAFAGIAKDIPEVAVDDPDGDAELLVLGWGSTWGAIQAAARRVREGGGKVAHAHLVHLNPFPANLGEVLRRYPKVLVPEMNLGQLSRLVRAEYLVDAQSLTKVQGLPFRAAELEAKMLEMING